MTKEETVTAGVKAARAATQAKHAVSNVADAVEIVGEETIEAAVSPLKALPSLGGKNLIIASLAVSTGVLAYRELRVLKAVRDHRKAQQNMDYAAAHGPIKVDNASDTQNSRHAAAQAAGPRVNGAS